MMGGPDGVRYHGYRMPPVETNGRREHWLQFDPWSMREWAMAPLGIALRLPPDLREASRVPRRVHVEEVIQAGKLPPGQIYVWQGHHRHRLCELASPLTPGHDCALMIGFHGTEEVHTLLSRITILSEA